MVWVGEQFGEDWFKDGVGVVTGCPVGGWGKAGMGEAREDVLGLGVAGVEVGK